MQLICVMTSAEIKNNDTDEIHFQFRSCLHQKQLKEAFKAEYDTEIAHEYMTHTQCNEMPLLKCI